MKKDIELTFVGKGNYTDSKLKKSIKEGDKIFVSQEQVGYLKKVKIDGKNAFELTNKQEKELENKKNSKKEDKKSKKVKEDMNFD